MKRYALRTLAVLATLVLLNALAAVLVPLLCAALMFLLLSPWAERLQTRGVPAAAGAALLVFVPAAAGVAALLAAAPLAEQWWQGVVGAVDRIAHRAPDGPLASVVVEAARWVQLQPWALPAVASERLAQALPLVLGAAATLMLVFFLLMAQRSLLAGVLRALSGGSAPLRLVRLLREVRAGVVTYFGVMALINLALAAATAAVISLLGLPGATAWLVVIFLLLFVPYLGPLAILLLLAAAGDHGGGSPIAAPLAFLVLHTLEANLLSPWLTGRWLALGRPALLVAVIVAGWAWGWAGGVLAVPLLQAAMACLRAFPRAAPAGRIAAALMDAEDPAAPSLADSANSAGAASNPAARVYRLPDLAESPSPCASASSPKPSRPKSTVSR